MKSRSRDSRWRRSRDAVDGGSGDRFTPSGADEVIRGEDLARAGDAVITLAPLDRPAARKLMDALKNREQAEARRQGG